MKRVTITAPFTDGLVTDVPPHLLGPRMAAFAQNMIVVDGEAQRRNGWAWSSGAQIAMPAAISGVMSAEFVLPGTSRRLAPTATATAHPQVHGNTASAAYDVLPRCVYRDELILCSQSGHRGLIRYAGAGYVNPAGDGSWSRIAAVLNADGGDRPTVAMSSTAGRAEFTYTLPNGNPGGLDALDDLVGAEGGAGWFLNWDGNAAPIYAAKIANVYDTNKGTLLQAVAAGSWSQVNANVMTFGTAYPAVSVYSAGTATCASTTMTGVGTEWLSGSWGAVDVGPGGGDNSGRGSVLLGDGSTWYHRATWSVSSDTSMQAISMPDISSPSQYHITRGLPFRDACVWKGSLCGTGVAQYPNRVYVCPPGWDLESPPGSVPPLRMEPASFQDADPNYFLVDFVDVPSMADTDPCVAVLPSAGPLLVLKEDAVYGIYGDFPSFSQSLIRKGAGCIDLRSTVDCKWGQFWAGRTGVYQFTPERGVVDITDGRINETWRHMVAAHRASPGFYCAAGQHGDKLVLSIGSLSSGETLVYDVATQRWDGFQTNHRAISFDTPRDDRESMLWAAGPGMDHRDRLRNSGLMLEGQGLPYDPQLGGGGNGTPPVFTAVTGSGMAQHEGIDGLSRMVDLSVSAEVVTAVADTGHERLAVSALVEGGIDDEGESVSVSVGMVGPTIAGAGSPSRVKRARGRIGRAGRLFAVKVDSTAFPSSPPHAGEHKVAVSQITATFRQRRGRA